MSVPSRRLSRRKGGKGIHHHPEVPSCPVPSRTIDREQDVSSFSETAGRGPCRPGRQGLRLPRGDLHGVGSGHAAFNPMLSPYYLKGDIPWDRCFPFGPDFYRDHDITCPFAAPVESLDPSTSR